MVENTNISEHNTKYAINQRLAKVAEYLNISSRSFAQLLEVDKSNLSTVLTGKREMPAEWVFRLSKIQPEVSMEWFVTGEGEMLKVLNPEKIDEKNREENEPLGAAQTFFSSNLKALLAAKEMAPSNLASLINVSTTNVNQLLEQQRGPSLALLLRLRQLWGISLDALLFQDLSDPENMENNLVDPKALAAQLEAMQKALEAVQRKMERMEKENEVRGRELEEVKREIKK